MYLDSSSVIRITRVKFINKILLPNFEITSQNHRKTFRMILNSAFVFVVYIVYICKYESSEKYVSWQSKCWSKFRCLLHLFTWLFTHFT